jgi:hypothetical protein
LRSQMFKLTTSRIVKGHDLPLRKRCVAFVEPPLCDQK